MWNFYSSVARGRASNRTWLRQLSGKGMDAQRKSSKRQPNYLSFNNEYSYTILQPIAFCVTLFKILKEDDSMFQKT